MILLDDKLISANALTEDLLNKSFYSAIVKRAIEEAPAVDAVEVIRCKDCRYSKFIKTYSKYMCDKHNRGSVELKYSNEFCSYGRRKTD